MEKKFLSIFQNIKVLIIEDNLSQREKLKEIISIFTDKIIMASDGYEGLELYNSTTPNLIITDIKMPNLDGLSFAEKIREMDSKIPIIVLTAYSDKEFLLQSVPLHLINYLEKPLSEEKLIETLKIAIDTIEEKSLLEVKLQDGYTYNLSEKNIYKDGKKTKLTKKEILFIELLLKHNKRIIEKEDIEKHLWEDGHMTSAALKNFIFKLRKKIGYDSIKTISSSGFSLQIQS